MRKVFKTTLTTLLLVFLGMLLVDPVLSCGFPNNNARKKAQNIKCIHNLRALDQAKEQWAHETYAIPGDPVVDSEVLELYGLRDLKCPAAGQYSLGPVDASPTCTIRAHTLAPTH